MSPIDPPEPRRHRPSCLVQSVAVVIAAVAVWGVYSLNRSRVVDDKGSQPTGQTNTESPTVPQNPGYLGPQACADCHRARVTEFMETRHFLACREPRPGTMPSGFEPGHGSF